MIRSPLFDWRVPALLVASFAGVFGATGAGAQPPQPFRWAGDAEGGAPYIEADPREPMRVVGLDVDIAELVAKELGRAAEFVQVDRKSTRLNSSHT